MNMKKIMMAALLLGSMCGKASATTVGDTIVIEDVKTVRTLINMPTPMRK